MLTRQAKSLWSYNPIPYGCVLYLPLWSPGLNGSGFKTPDPYNRTCTATAITPAPEGQTFDGVSSEITGSFSPCSGLSAFWIGIWLKYTSVAENKAVYSEKVASGDTMFQIYANGDGIGKIVLWYSDLALPTMTISHAGSYNDGVWHFVECARRASNSLELLVDGVSRGTAANALGAPSTPNILAIGRQAETAGTFYVGDVGEIITCNRNVSASEGSYYSQQTKGRYL